MPPTVTTFDYLAMINEILSWRPGSEGGMSSYRRVLQSQRWEECGVRRLAYLCKNPSARSYRGKETYSFAPKTDREAKHGRYMNDEARECWVVSVDSKLFCVYLVALIKDVVMAVI